MDNNGKLNTEDEAAVKLVEDGEANMKVEIQLVGSDTQNNGDTKISVTELKAAFIGMGKDELMKFSNDPFWIKLRWFLFILFWVLWFGMLFGAIAIILLAPKCSSPEPRAWYENSPIYHLSVANFKDGSKPQDGVGDFEGILEKVDYFKELGINTLMIDSIMPSTMDNPEKIEDFKQIDTKYGSMDKIKEILGILKEKGIHVIMNIVPNYSSKNHIWFQKSIQKELPYTDYYIWSNGKGDMPPNNWLSVNGGPAWTYNENRKQYYLHQFNESQPDLNFRNPEVVDYFSDVFRWWLNLGFSGIHVDKVDYLLENANLTDETIGNNPGTVHDQYDFFRHINTKDLPELVNIIKQWSTVFDNASGVFSVNGIPDSEEFNTAKLIHRPLIIKNGTITADHLERYINHKLKMEHQTWTVEYIGNEQPSYLSECLTNLMLLLPGTLVVPSGSELGLTYGSIMPWDNSSNAGFTTANKTWKEFSYNFHENNVEKEIQDVDSYYNTFKNLVKERTSPSIIHGTTETAVINSTVFAFTRLKSGHPGFLVAFNLEPKETVVNLGNMKLVPQELVVIARSKNLWDQLPIKSSIVSSNLKMAPNSCVVLQFVPET